MINPDQINLQVMRQKVLAGTITVEEIKQALAVIRLNREAAQHSSAGGTGNGGKTASKKAAVQAKAASLLDELEGL